jgi:protein-disulfide isomerase
MFRKITVVLAAATALLAQVPSPKASAPAEPKPQIDKAKLEAYIRHLFVWPPPITIEVSDPKPAPIAGFYEVNIRGSQGKSSQDETFYVSQDGQKMIRGTVFDVAQNPFKVDLDKIKTDFQPSFGTAGAPVALVEFSDFECPYCREEAKILRENLAKEYPKQVHFYYLDYPLESLHPWAKSAAIAGRCIFHQNASAFWDYHDWIFASQEGINPDNLKSKILDFMKDKGGVDASQLSTCMDSKATESEVERTKAEGRSLEVSSTPTLFVNGRRMVGSVQWEDLKRVIDYEIEYQKTAKNAGEDCGCSVSLPMPGAAPPGNSAGGLK